MAALSENTQGLDNQTGSLEHFIKIPLCYQETVYTCGVACVQSILAGYGIIYRQDILIEMLKQKPIFGTDPQNIISFMQMLDFQASLNNNLNISKVKAYIDRGITPILIIQAWKDDDIGYADDWRDSHYVIACGYDNNRIIFMDPYTLGNYTCLTYSELMERWHSLDPSGRQYDFSGLLIENENLKFKYQPDIIKHMG